MDAKEFKVLPESEAERDERTRPPFLGSHCSKVPKGRATPPHASCSNLKCECPCHLEEP
jgi:hypothetical protein